MSHPHYRFLFKDYTDSSDFLLFLAQRCLLPIRVEFDFSQQANVYTVADLTKKEDRPQAPKECRLVRTSGAGYILQPLPCEVPLADEDRDVLRAARHLSQCQHFSDVSTALEDLKRAVNDAPNESSW